MYNKTCLPKENSGKSAFCLPSQESAKLRGYVGCVGQNKICVGQNEICVGQNKNCVGQNKNCVGQSKNCVSQKKILDLKKIYIFL